MNNSETREFAVALAKADTEEAVIRILQEAGYWDDASVWREYGGDSMNYSTIGNQQSSADNALVEKLVNSVDAVLMRECLKCGIQPDSDNAPQSIAKAQRAFFNIRDGRLSSVDARERSRLAENIMLAATGSKRKPSFAIIDRGEGQSPKRMPETILSLTKSNKIKIPFVQGKFGMGGSGVLRFCSPNHNLLLVISRRNREIHEDIDRTVHSEKDDTRDLWGVTVVRREDPKPGDKSSYYTYLAPNKKILSFDADELPLIPGPHPAQYGRPLDSGTFIKLYEYDVGPLKTLILFNLYYRLSLLMPGVGLPVRFMERRDYQGESFDTIFAGLSVRLDDDKHENLEPEFQTPGTGKITVEGQVLPYSIYVFKKGKKENYAKREGVVFSVNGQAHGFLSKEFFTRRSVKMSYLSDSILVMVDCSKISRRKQEELFMPSRDRLAMTSIRYSIEEKLEGVIKNHPGLKDLQSRRRDEIIKDKLQDSKPLAEILNEVIKKSPTLAALFSSGVRLSNPSDIMPVSPTKKFNGEKFPSHFKLIKQSTKDNPKRCPINHRFRVQYETDVVNNYFERDSEPGELQLTVNGETMQDYSLNLWNGLANLTIKIPDNVKIGDTLRFATAVNDVTQIQPFTEEFYVLVAEEQGKRSGTRGERKDPPSDEKGQGRHKKSSLDMPRVFNIRQEDWGKDDYREFHFDKYSALKVRPAEEEEGYDFFINLDNLYLRNEITRNAEIAPEILEMRYRCGMVLLGLSVLNFDENRKKKQSKEDNEANDANGNELPVDERISQLTEAISPTLLPMISHLGSADFEG